MPAEAVDAPWAELVFEGPALDAEVYLNGVCVGEHLNAFYPCRLNVAGRLRAGVNILAVILDAGLHGVGERSASEYLPGRDDAPLHKRMWLRKPQYQFAWDWSPRLVNVGIFRPARLECQPRIDQVSAIPRLSADHTSAELQVRVHLVNPPPSPTAC
ncbi:MAG: hypothetical protein GXY52_08440 [Chloroflexi bacterium]|nr:hypothetical protein [Chloroflexota bacterium]